ncbi:hypothetical protein [uncultured Campylobacter sp.]|uniref:hypothetical protein n=1 Tax=uncultured Campylobacter sp. TaxID=218934 RepID=UPI00260F5D16|nr:hypothetical protein [uncultured Campylobacter sp.]
MSDLADFNYEKKYDGNKKILIIAADERYLLMDNGTFFSTGNHPVETLVPMYHWRRRAGTSRSRRSLEIP